MCQLSRGFINKRSFFLLNVSLCGALSHLRQQLPQRTIGKPCGAIPCQCPNCYDPEQRVAQGIHTPQKTRGELVVRGSSNEARYDIE
jgi:hypothetical protein